jgi:hypothetical protein
MSLREAYDYLRLRRPIIGPNLGFIKQVRTLKDVCSNCFEYRTQPFLIEITEKQKRLSKKQCSAGV